MIGREWWSYTLWEVGKVWNDLVRGESGWISFAEREVKCIVDWLLRIVYEESLVSDIGRTCLMEVGYKSRWWTRCNHVCDNIGLWELVNLLWLRNINKGGMAMLRMKYDRNVWKKTFVARIQEYGRRQWRNCFWHKWERTTVCIHEESTKKNSNGSVGARLRLMVRGRCLPRVQNGSPVSTRFYGPVLCFKIKLIAFLLSLGRRRLRPQPILTAALRRQRSVGIRVFIEDCKSWGV